jgi:hypothetical protein
MITGSSFVSSRPLIKQKTHLKVFMFQQIAFWTTSSLDYIMKDTKIVFEVVHLLQLEICQS